MSGPHQDIVDVLGQMRDELRSIRRVIGHSGDEPFVPHAERLSYSYQEAADRVGCSISTIRRVVNEGRVASFPLEGTSKIVIPKSSLEDWIERSKKAT